MKSPRLLSRGSFAAPRSWWRLWRVLWPSPRLLSRGSFAAILLGFKENKFDISPRLLSRGSFAANPPGLQKL